jgi:hypothetical protein
MSPRSPRAIYGSLRPIHGCSQRPAHYMVWPSCHPLPWQRHGLLPVWNIKLSNCYISWDCARRCDDLSTSRACCRYPWDGNTGVFSVHYSIIGCRHSCEPIPLSRSTRTERRVVEHQDGIRKLTIKIHWFITTLFPLNKPHMTHQQKP